MQYNCIKTVNKFIKSVMKFVLNFWYVIWFGSNTQEKIWRSLKSGYICLMDSVVMEIYRADNM